MENLGEFLEQVARRYGTKPALLYHPGNVTEVWTYAELPRRAARVTAWLQEQGVEKGDRVVLWGANSPAWVACYFGALRAGAILVPLDVRSSPDFVARAVDRAAPKMALLSEGPRDSWPYPVPTGQIEELAVLPEPARPARPVPVAPDDIAALMFTSGTTGDPKGVILTHGNILANVEQTDPVVPTIPEFRTVSVLPLSHMFEQTAGLLLSLWRGAQIYYLANLQPTTLFATFSEHRPTTMLLVPQLLHLLMEGIEREVQRQGKMQAWQRLQQIAGHLPMRARRLLFRQVHERLGGAMVYLISGGAPLAPEMIRKWELLGIPIVQGYGMTEASPVVSTTSLREHLPAAVGRAIPGVEVKIAADGEVLVRGANITPGYWQNEEQTREAFADGWYKSGDLGSLDAEGHLFLHGRKKDLIVLANGENVYAEDVEAALKQITGVADAAVVGLPTPQGAMVHAVLLLATPGLDPQAIVRQANAGLAPHQQIRGHTIWAEADFPRTFTLKVKKHEVVSAVLAERDRVASGAAPRSTLQSREEQIIARLVQSSGMDPALVTAETRLGDIVGLDSLAQLELLSALEAEVGSPIDESQVGPDTTVAALATLLERSAAGAAPLAAPSTAPHLQAGDAGRASWGIRVFGVAVRLLFRGLFHVRVSGRRRVPSTPAIICANHLGWTDPFLVLLFFPVKPRVYVVGEAQVREISGFRDWVIDKLQIMVDLDRNNPTHALRTMQDVLQRGGSLLIFPEGHLGTEEGRLQPLQAGAAEAAIACGVPIVPVGLTGTHELWLRRTLTLRIGRPIDPAAFSGDTRTRAAAITRRLAAQMQALLPGDDVPPRRKPLSAWLTRLF